MKKLKKIFSLSTYIMLISVLHGNEQLEIKSLLSDRNTEIALGFQRWRSSNSQKAWEDQYPNYSYRLIRLCIHSPMETSLISSAAACAPCTRARVHVDRSQWLSTRKTWDSIPRPVPVRVANTRSEPWAGDPRALPE